MRFLITGINGFNGPHLARELVGRGHNVVGMSHHEVNNQDGILGQIDLISGDLTDVNDIHDIFRTEQFDGVFHLASKTHPPTSFQKPVEYFTTNALGTVYIVEAMRAHQPDAVLMNCSTCEVYGIQPAGTYINEKTPTLASNPYAVSKLAADIYIQERCANGLLKAFITRSFSHTGAGRPANYSISSDAYQIAKIIKGKQESVIKVGNLSCQRAVMDVRDVVAVYANLMDKYTADDRVVEYGEVWNIGGDNPRTIDYYLQSMLEIFGVEADLQIDDKLYRKFDIPVQHPDSTKVRNLLGWNPKYDIIQTLTDLVQHWLERV